MNFCLPFGNYTQVHQNKEPHSSTKEWTLGAISLGPIDNAQGRWKFVSLETGHLIKQYLWDAMPMTQEVTNKVIECGKQENSPKGFITWDFNGNVDHNKFECDDIKGVHGHDTQHNLNPSKNNDNNFIDQIDDGDDSSHIDSDQEDNDLSFDTNDNKNCNDDDDCMFNNNVDVIRSDKNEDDNKI